MNIMLRDALSQAVTELYKMGGEMPMALQTRLWEQGIKNAAGLTRSIRAAIRALYNTADISAFLGQMYAFIESQFTAAWFEGMADNGLGKDEMTEEWALLLSGLIVSEEGFVYEFGNEIVDASIGLDGTIKPIDPFLARAELWGNRYNEIVNQARLVTAAAGQKMIWVFGDTDHCDTCQSLNGIVAFAKEWEVSGVRPQNAPNNYLSCGGWRCQCRLEPTDQRHTTQAFGRILSAMAGG